MMRKEETELIMGYAAHIYRYKLNTKGKRRGIMGPVSY
jgi:hypothetical protein